MLRQTLIHLAFLYCCLSASYGQSNCTIYGSGDTVLSHLTIHFIDPVSGLSRFDSLKPTSNQYKFEWESPYFLPVSVISGKNAYRIYGSQPGTFEINYYSRNSQVTFVAAGKNAPSMQLYQTFQNQYDKELEALLESYAENTVDGLEADLYDLKKKQLAYLKEEKERAGIDDPVFSSLNLEIKFRYATPLLAKASWGNVLDKSKPVKSLPSLYSEEFKKMEINCPSMTHSLWYINFLKCYIAYFAAEANGFKTPVNIQEQVNREYLIANTRLTGNARLFYLAFLLSQNMEKIESGLIVQMLDILKSDPVSKSTEKKLSQMWKEVQKKKSKMKQEAKKQVSSAYNFSLTGVDGKTFKLDDFKGKVVYIDFWASWCGPCRQQFPFSKLLHESLSEKQKKEILFMYISIDDKEETWKESIDKFELKGINGISKGGWQSEVCKYFKINSIPRYMIMNKKGEIVIPDAKRPGDESLKEELIKLSEE